MYCLNHNLKLLNVYAIDNYWTFYWTLWNYSTFQFFKWIIELVLILGRSEAKHDQVTEHCTLLWRLRVWTNYWTLYFGVHDLNKYWLIDN